MDHARRTLNTLKLDRLPQVAIRFSPPKAYDPLRMNVNSVHR
jgi:hypothetical protein